MSAYTYSYICVHVHSQGRLLYHNQEYQEAKRVFESCLISFADSLHACSASKTHHFLAWCWYRYRYICICECVCVCEIVYMHIHHRMFTMCVCDHDRTKKFVESKQNSEHHVNEKIEQHARTAKRISPALIESDYILGVYKKAMYSEMLRCRSHKQASSYREEAIAHFQRAIDAHIENRREVAFEYDNELDFCESYYKSYAILAQLHMNQDVDRCMQLCRYGALFYVCMCVVKSVCVQPSTWCIHSTTTHASLSTLSLTYTTHTHTTVSPSPTNLSKRSRTKWQDGLTARQGNSRRLWSRRTRVCMCVCDCMLACVNVCVCMYV